MIQEILTYIIVFSASAYAVYKTILFLTASGSNACSGCGGQCSIKQELAQKKNPLR